MYMNKVVTTKKKERKYSTHENLTSLDTQMSWKVEWKFTDLISWSMRLVVFRSRSSSSLLRQLQLSFCNRARMANFGDQGPRPTDCVTKVAISVSCDNLLDMDTFSKSDPLCVLSMNSTGPHWCEVIRPEQWKLWNFCVIHTLCKNCIQSTCECLSTVCNRNPNRSWFCLFYLSDWPDREDHELPQPQVFQDLCHRLLLWDGAEVALWDLRHRQWSLQCARRRLPGGTGVHVGTGESSLSGSRRWKIHLNLSLRVKPFCDFFVCIQIVSSKQLTKPLLMKDKRPAGKGTITVSYPSVWFIQKMFHLAGLTHAIVSANWSK